MLSGTAGLPCDPAKGLAILEPLATAGNSLAGNNFAWALCTGPDAALRDPAKGVAVIAKVIKQAPTANYLDTQGACLAATADFSQAMEVQRQAIASLPVDDKTTRERMQARLTLYQRRQVFVEDPAKLSAVAPSTAAAKK